MRPVSAEDVPFLWAAYKKGVFAGLPPDLTVDSLVSALAPASGRMSILLAKNKELGGKITPVGLVVIDFADKAGYRIIPTPAWFPWSSSRNRLECSVKWLNEARKTLMPMFHVEQKDRAFCLHLKLYGVIREVGFEKCGIGPTTDSYAWQGVR